MGSHSFSASTTLFTSATRSTPSVNSALALLIRCPHCCCLVCHRLAFHDILLVLSFNISFLVQSMQTLYTCLTASQNCPCKNDSGCLCAVIRWKSSTIPTYVGLKISKNRCPLAKRGCMPCRLNLLLCKICSHVESNLDHLPYSASTISCSVQIVRHGTKVWPVLQHVQWAMFLRSCDCKHNTNCNLQPACI